MPVIKNEKLKLTLFIFGYCDRLFFVFSDFKLGPKKGMLSTLCLNLFNRTKLVEGLSVDANFHPQPHSMSDYNVIPKF